MSEQTQKRPEIRGKVIALLEEWQNNAGTFRKREIVVETGFRYSCPIKVTFKKDAIAHLEGVAEGDCVIIPYVLDGREYEGRFFVDIIGMGLQKIGASVAKAVKPVIGCTAATAIDAWTQKHGEDKAGFVAVCKQLKPGKPSKEYTIADWADVINAINKPAAAAVETDAEDVDVDDLSF